MQAINIANHYETVTYRNNWGWEVSGIEPCTIAELTANGIEYVVWNYLDGTPTYHTSRYQADLHAELLGTLYADYAVAHKCQENPEVKHRKGIIVQGPFAGLPVEFQDGKPGVSLFAQFHAI